MLTPTFAIIGIGGYVAPKHLAAITRVGGEIVGAYDTHDSVGILDRYAPEARFFTYENEFMWWLEDAIPDALVVCSPNDVHLHHCLLGIRADVPKVVCEKPLVISPQQLATLRDHLNNRGGERTSIHPVLQLRLHPDRERLADRLRKHDTATLTYHTYRGPWYDKSWKGRANRSGGVSMNIGIHLFDLLIADLGVPEVLDYRETSHDMQGEFFFSSCNTKLQVSLSLKEKTCRQFTFPDGEPVVLDSAFDVLHNQLYRDIFVDEKPTPTLDDAAKAVDFVFHMQRGTL